ncbi:DUF6011 domain-containing protein [Streptomyces sp. NPDC000941]
MTALRRSCGRPLQDPESIAVGLGPKRRRALRPDPASGGKLALDVETPTRPHPPLALPHPLAALATRRPPHHDPA